MKSPFVLISLLFGFAASENVGSSRTTVADIVDNPDTISRRLDFDILANLQGKEELTGDESILTVAQNTKDLSNLVSLILFADPSIADTLDSPGRYTVFAPSNLSFQALFDQFDVNAASLALLDKQDGTLTTALKYHVIKGVYDIKDFSDGLILNTLQGESVILNLSDDGDSGFTVNDATIQSSDILANNGVIHVIDGVLVPEELSGDEEPEANVPDSSETEVSEPSEESDVEETSSNSIVDVAQSTDNLSNLVSLIVVADPSIADALSSPGNYTVFAPSNLAFQNLFDSFNVDATALGVLDDTTGILTTVLKYHVVQGVYESSDIVDGLEVTTLQGEDVTLNLSDDSATGFAVNNIEILAADVFADNGVVHVINGVLVPRELAAEEEPDVEETSSNSIVDVAQRTDDLSNLVSLIVVADPSIADVLSSPGNYTVFAPSNLSFQKLFDNFDVDATALGVLDNTTGILSTILKYHVVQGVYESSDIVDGLEVTTLQGEDVILNFSDDSATGFAVNNIEILAADVFADNGVVHVINGVLVPIELAVEEESEAIVPESNVTEFEEPSAEVSDTVIDIAIGDPDLTILVDLVVQTNLTEVLSASGSSYTIFAPSNDAFLGVLDDVSDLSILDDETVTALLQYHVVEGLYPGSSITDGLELTTLQGETISFNKTDDGIFVNQASISATDVLASNGVVHIIDDVLFPAAVFQTADESSSQINSKATIVEIASGAPDFSNLVSAILLADESIVKLLSSPGDFTVFAPTNFAFEKVLDNLDISIDDLVNLDLLSQILTYHVVDGSYESSEIVDGLEITTLQGDDITLTLTDDSPSGVAVNGVNVVNADILASNGVIHAIDSVLMAPSIVGVN